MLKVRRSQLVLGSSLLLLLSAACEKGPPPVVTEPSSKVATATTTTTASAEATPSASTASAPVAMPKDVSELAKGSNQLGFDLYGRLRTAPGNLALSPASISSAFAMTYGGAKGETASQMKKTLHFTGDPDATMTSWGQAQRALTSPERPMKIRIANRLFGEKTYTFEPPYLDKTKTAFDASLEPTDFKTAFDASRTHINSWVEDQTEKRIKDLLPPPAVTADTRLVLVNAIYFLADWERPFDKERTKDEPFHVNASSSKKVPTMKRTEMMSVGRGDEVTIVELPYKGGSTAMWVVVPDAVDGLPNLEKNLSAARLDTWKTKLKSQQTALELPRFEVSPTESTSLKKELKALGMNEPFERLKADFTSIANPTDPREKLHISDAFHKAFVKTDEKGTEAAAATAVVMAIGGGMPPPPTELKVDRPFLFLIMDKSSSLVLFMGRVTDPSSK